MPASKTPIHLDFLRALAKSGTQSLDYDVFKSFCDRYGGEQSTAQSLIYLRESGLIETGINGLVIGASGEPFISLGAIKITAKGLDRISETKGLYTESQSVTIKIDQETMDGLESIINNLNLPMAEKETLLKKLKDHGAKELLSMAMKEAVTYGPLLGMALSSLARG